MSEIKAFYLEMRTVGSSLGDVLICDGLFAQSGSISDGIALRFKRDAGGWVLSFEDLERVYKAAIDFRKQYPDTIRDAIRRRKADYENMVSEYLKEKR